MSHDLYTVIYYYELSFQIINKQYCLISIYGHGFYVSYMIKIHVSFIDKEQESENVIECADGNHSISIQLKSDQIRHAIMINTVFDNEAFVGNVLLLKGHKLTGFNRKVDSF